MGKADDTATFGIDLDGSGAVAGADDVSGALAKLHQKLDEDTSALSGMRKALTNLKGGGAVAEAQVTKLKAAIAAQKATIAQTQSKVIDLGGSYKRTKPAADQMSSGLGALLARAQSAGGPLGGLVAKLGGLKTALAGGALIAGTVALAAALLLVVAGAAAATAALTKYALASADAYRSERLQLEGLVNLRSWYGRAKESAGFLQQQIDRVSSSTALGRDQIGGLAEEFHVLGLRGGNLQHALRGASIALATQGQRGLAQFKAMALGAGRYGGSIKKVADDFEARLGPIARAQMLSLDVQTKKLKESFSALFTGVKVEKFLSALKSITDLFSQNTVTGQALKTIMSSIFTPILDGIAVLAPLAKRFFQGMVLGALDLAIGIILLRNWFRKTFGDSSILKSLESQRKAFETGRFVVYAFAAAIVLTALAFGLLAAGVGILVATVYAPLLLVAAPFVLIYLAVKKLMNLDWSAIGSSIVGAFGTVGDVLGGIASGYADIGYSLILGLVKGIKRGYSLVAEAVKGLGNLAKSVLKNALESRSPSRAGDRIAYSLPQGSAQGVNRGTPLVVRAVAKQGAASLLEFKSSISTMINEGKKAPTVDGTAGAALPAVAGAPAPSSAPFELAAAPARPAALNLGNAGVGKGTHVEIHNLNYQGEENRAPAETLRDGLIRVLREIGASSGATLETA